MLAGLALGARVIPWLAAYPLHPDEALYGYWARLIASGRDPLLLTPWIDKPPLALYALAGSIRLFGASELALRLPGMVASLLTLIPLSGLARRISTRTGGWLAVALYALSPFAVLFAPTAFTDPWLALWLTAAAWAAVNGQGFAAGVALGLAMASKQQGVLGVPLVIGLLTLAGPQCQPRWPVIVRRLLAGVLGCALIVGPLIWWDSLRWHNRPSFWERSLTTYGGLGLTAVADWPARAGAWAEPLGYLFGFPALSVFVLGLAAWTGWRARRLQPADQPWSPRRPAIGFLALYTAGYLALHFVVSFRPWDRYLLPLLPIVALLAGDGLTALWTRLRGHKLQWLAAVAWTVALSWALWLGVTGRVPVGSDHGAYTGARQLAAAIADLPADGIVYYRSLGWHFDFYLFDAPQERRWWDAVEDLAAKAAATAAAEPTRPQFLTLTATEAVMLAPQNALAQRRLALDQVLTIGGMDGRPAFVLYRIVGASGE